MKKRFVSILLVAAMTASLAACGGSNGGDNSASATEKGGKTEWIVNTFSDKFF